MDVYMRVRILETLPLLGFVGVCTCIIAMALWVGR